MDLIGSVLPIEINHLCINKLWQTLKEIITGELSCRQKKINLLPLESQNSCSVCGGLVVAVQQHFAMANRFLSYRNLKGHCALLLFELRGITQTQRRFSESKLIKSILVQPYSCRQHNSWACLLSAGKWDGFYWFVWFFSLRQPPWMRLFKVYEHNDAPSRLAAVFLHSTALCCGGYISSVCCSVFSTGANLCDTVCILIMYTNFSAIYKQG